MTTDDWHEAAKENAKQHVDWFLEMLRPLLIDHMIHGFKHGVEFIDPKLFKVIDKGGEDN